MVSSEINIQVFLKRQILKCTRLKNGKQEQNIQRRNEFDDRLFTQPYVVSNIQQMQIKLCCCSNPAIQASEIFSCGIFELKLINKKQNMVLVDRNNNYIAGLLLEFIDREMKISAILADEHKFNRSDHRSNSIARLIECFSPHIGLFVFYRPKNIINYSIE